MHHRNSHTSHLNVPTIEARVLARLEFWQLGYIRRHQCEKDRGKVPKRGRAGSKLQSGPRSGSQPASGVQCRCSEQVRVIESYRACWREHEPSEAPLKKQFPRKNTCFPPPLELRATAGLLRLRLREGLFYILCPGVPLTSNKNLSFFDKKEVSVVSKIKCLKSWLKLVSNYSIKIHRGEPPSSIEIKRLYHEE